MEWEQEDEHVPAQDISCPRISSAPDFLDIRHFPWKEGEANWGLPWADQELLKFQLVASVQLYSG